MLKDIAISAVSSLIPSIMEILSPQIREMIIAAIDQWYEKAKQTENPWDNYAVALVAGVMGMKLKG